MLGMELAPSAHTITQFRKNGGVTLSAVQGRVQFYGRYLILAHAAPTWQRESFDFFSPCDVGVRIKWNRRPFAFTTVLLSEHSDDNSLLCFSLPIVQSDPPSSLLVHLVIQSPTELTFLLLVSPFPTRPIRGPDDLGSLLPLHFYPLKHITSKHGEPSSRYD